MSHSGLDGLSAPATHDYLFRLEQGTRTEAIWIEDVGESAFFTAELARLTAKIGFAIVGIFVANTAVCMDCVL